MNYQELKNAIIEVIRTNGNEEITGEVLQFVLLEMVSSLGKDFQFAGVATPQTEIIERDDKVAWVLGAGTYENFGIPFTVAVDEIAFVLYNGTYRVQKVKTGVIVDDTLTRDGQNPVKGGAIYAEFDKLRAAGYLFAGVATPSLLPPANLTEKIFYLATQGGEYTNLDNITLQKGINIIRFDGTSWIGESLIAITDEVIDSNVSLITAAGVYSGLSGKVDKVEGMGLSQNSYTNTEKSKLGALPTAQELVQMLGGKQDMLTFDTTPTLNSQNPVTSDGIQRAIEAILVLIPSAATALNQLADKSFVNSTVATASATFRGTYNLVSDLSLAVTATHAQIAAALAGAVSGADNNDYCFVQIPTSGDTPTEIRVTERYKFNGETWAYEYDLNNSGFTAAQWEAINSAITSALVTKLSNLPDATQLANLFAGKQNTLSFDDAPASGSVNPVKSGGIYDAIAAITAVIPSTATSSNKLVDLNALTAYVTGIIGALDASFDLTSTDGHVTLKMTQVDGVITTLQILTSDIASAQALATLDGQVSTNADDIAALQALYNALQQSAPEVIEPTDTWPVANPSTTVIYRVIDRVNTPPEYYSDYMFRASDLTTPVLMAQYNNAIDPRPKKGSANLVTSGGVFDNMGALDVSKLNATGDTLATYATLDAAIAAIPSDYQKGGMSIKFIQGTVQSSDNKYVQYRLMSDAFSTIESDWQEMDTVRGENVYNANYGKTPGTSFTLSAAIQDVPLSYRRTGLILIFRDNSLNVNAYYYKVGQIGDQFFEDTGNWIQIPIRPILMSLCDNKLLRAIGIADSVFPQWAPNTLYKVGAIIKNDDNLMRCKTEHTSGESYDASKFGVTTYGEFLRRYGGSVILNYTTMKGVAPISFSSLTSTFLATIDSLYREAGLILMIRTSNKGILYYQYNTANITDEYWNDTSNWVLLYSTAWGINDDFISQITQTINNVKELTENAQLTLQNTGKAYNTGTVSVGSVYTESLVGNSVIDSGKVSVKKGDTLYIKGKGAGNPRLWCIVDSSNKVVAISEPGAASTQYIRLDINQDGTVYYNTRNDEPDYPFGGYIVFADNITAIAEKIAYITDEPKVISFDNEGKAYNTGNVAVGSTFDGTLSTNASFDSVRVTVKRNDVVLVKGQGGQTPLLWCITDTTGKVLSKSESSFKAYEYATIVIGQDGYVYLNARNDSEDCPLGALLTNNYNLPYLSDLVNKKPTGKWLAMGDSITEGYFSWFTDEPNDIGTSLVIPTKTWVYKLSAMTGKSVINAGIGGTGYKKKGAQGDKLNAKELVDTLDFTGVDVVTLAYGINDYKGSETLGTMADDVSTGNTVVANMRYVIEHIIASNPNIKILVIMPLNARGYSSQRLGDETTNYALGYQVNDKTLQDFYDAMVEVCKYYGIEYVDATHTSVINRKSAAKLLPDGVHPSENAHTLLAKEFARVLIR